MLALIPYMIKEAEDCINLILTQTIQPSLLPIDNLKKTIPIHSKISLLTADSTASLSMSDYHVTYKLHEFYPAFILYQLVALPYAPQTNNNYLKHPLTNSLVAVNNLHETFLYNRVGRFWVLRKVMLPVVPLGAK